MPERATIQEPVDRAEMYEVSQRCPGQHRPLPSETRDFVPTPRGWALILAATALLAWVVWHAGGDEAGIAWLTISAMIAYMLAMAAWGAIRLLLDARDDNRAGPPS